MSYLDDILTSYREAYPRSTPITRARWLDGENGWRQALRRIGELASRMSAAAATTPIPRVRREWQRLIREAYLWMPGYIQAVPILRETEELAKHNDDVFMQFMRDLATLAGL